MAPTVLIVDDHAGFRSVARRILKMGGFEVVGEAIDSDSALRAVADLKPQLVLLDMQLPGLNGVEVARTITSGPAPPTVVLVSSREAADYGADIHNCGARGFLAKSDLSGSSLTELLAKSG